jgi:enamine deaminase RidA (YjgF/YER057c/UK114 family)
MPHNSLKLARPFAAYAHSRRVGELIFLAGQGCRDPESDRYRGIQRHSDGSIASYDIKEMTRGVFRNMERALAVHGLSLSDLVDVTVYLKSMSDFEAMNSVWNDEFKDHQPPTRTTVAVADLPGDNLVEMKGIAADQRARL